MKFQTANEKARWNNNRLCYFNLLLNRHCSTRIRLRGSLPKSGPLDFATKNTFPLFFVGEEALVGVY